MCGQEQYDWDSEKDYMKLLEYSGMNFICTWGKRLILA